MNIRCQYRTEPFWDGSMDRKIYSCQLTSASITKPDIEIKTIVGDHGYLKDNNEVEAVQFKNTVVEHCPRGLSKWFPRITVLEITNCGLKVISRAALSGHHHLEIINLANNQLTSLPDDLFLDTPKLKMVRCTDNKISRMSSKLLAPVKNGLKFVNFLGNAKINALYVPGHKLSTATVSDLMRVIDEMCDQPPSTTGETTSRLTTKQVSISKNRLLKLAQGFEGMLLSGQFSDFTVVTGTRKFRVHKCVLAIGCSEFAKMFAVENPENHATELNIEDLKEKSVEAFLRYLYTGSITEDINAEEVFSLAAKLNVPELKEFTENLIVDDVSESTALKVFCLGHSYNSQKLKQAAFNKIKKMFPDKQLSNTLMENPEALKELIEMKHKLDRFVNDFEDLVIDL